MVNRHDLRWRKDLENRFCAHKLFPIRNSRFAPCFVLPGYNNNCNSVRANSILNFKHDCLRLNRQSFKRRIMRSADLYSNNCRCFRETQYCRIVIFVVIFPEPSVLDRRLFKRVWHEIFVSLSLDTRYLGNILSDFVKWWLYRQRELCIFCLNIIIIRTKI